MSLHVCVREKERGGGGKKEKEKGKLKQKKNVSLDEIPSKNKWTGQRYRGIIQICVCARRKVNGGTKPIQTLNLLETRPPKKTEDTHTHTNTHTHTLSLYLPWAQIKHGCLVILLS